MACNAVCLKEERRKESTAIQQRERERERERIHVSIVYLPGRACYHSDKRSEHVSSPFVQVHMLGPLELFQPWRTVFCALFKRRFYHWSRKQKTKGKRSSQACLRVVVLWCEGSEDNSTAGSPIETFARPQREKVMEREDSKKGEDGYPRLLDLIPNERVVQDGGGGGRRTVGRLDASEEKKLELRLGLPGGDLEEEEEPSILSLGFISKASSIRGDFEAAESKNEGVQHQETGVLELQSRARTAKEWPYKTTWVTGKFKQQQILRKEKADGDGPSTSSSSKTSLYAMPSAAADPVVGWPPIRSFRKNLAANSAKQRVEPVTRNIEEEVKLENNNKGLFVKINMDGIPIGRKVDLKVYDSYEKLSFAVEGLFLGLFEAQKDTSTNASQKEEETRKAFIGLLGGSGEYTLVYEDNEGHRMLVGDVPWEMFVSTVKRLRVLKNPVLSSLPVGSVRRKRTATECVEIGENDFGTELISNKLCT